LLLSFEIFIDEVIVVVGIRNIRLRSIALIDGKPEVACSLGGHNEIHILFEFEFERKLVVQGQINDFSVVDADEEKHVFAVLVLDLDYVVGLGGQTQEHCRVGYLLFEVLFRDLYLGERIFVVGVLQRKDGYFQVVEGHCFRSGQMEVDLGV